MNLSISKKFSYFNWFATLGIVLFHSCPSKEFEINTTGFNKLLAEFYPIFIDRMGHVCLTFFFFVSSFLLYYNTTTFHDALNKIKRRIKTLLVPYLAWSFIVAFIKIILHKIDVFDFLKNPFEYIFFKPVIGALWYILALLSFLLLYPIFVLTRKNKIISSFVFLTPMLYLMIKKFFSIPDLFVLEGCTWYSKMIFYMPVYLLGGYIGLNFPVIIDTDYNDKKYIYIGCSLILISFLLFSICFDRSFYVLFSVIFLVGIWLLLDADIFARKLPLYFNSAFFIYVLHQPLLIPLIHAVLKGTIPIGVTNAIITIIVEIITLFFVVMASYFVREFLKLILPKKGFDLLSGGR